MMKGRRTMELSKKSNLLELDPYKYELQDVSEPNLFREIFPYTEVPKVHFNYRRVPRCMPKEIRITDTTFRDGQQSQAPYSPKQIADIYDMLHRLSGEKGIISQTEFFVYSDKDLSLIHIFCLRHSAFFYVQLVYMFCNTVQFQHHFTLILHLSNDVHRVSTIRLHACLLYTSRCV